MSESTLQVSLGVARVASSADKQHDLFSLSLSVWLFATIMGQSMLVVEIPSWDGRLKLLRLGALALMVVNELGSGQSKLSLPKLGVFFLVIFGATWFSLRMYILEAGAIIFFGRNCDSNKVIMAALRGMTLGCAAVLVGVAAGVIENYMFNWNDRIRFGLGFRYATYLPAHLYAGVLMFVYLRPRMVSWLWVIVMTVGACWLFALTDSRMLFVSTVAAVVLWVLVARFSQEGWPYWFEAGTRFVPWVLIALPTISYLSAKWYNQSMSTWAQANNVLSGRLALGHDALEEWRLTLLGQPVEFNAIEWTSSGALLPEHVNVVDSSYLRTMIYFGVVTLVLLTWAMLKLHRTAVRDHNAAFVTIIVGLAIVGLFEPRLLTIEDNPFLILVGGELNAVFRTKEAE